ncbi:nucleoside/nucleotide kinase family protein [Rhodococcoides navarretei]|uniref:Uridine kinase n=1 Tax=Rhodococcus navarretei TaxID=3128981 RepID=A0ABU9CWK2_9NOCA
MDGPGKMVGVVQPVPIFPDLLVESIVDSCPDGARSIVVIDGADAARPVDFATRTAEHARSRGRPADIVDLHDYVRPASIRFEYSRTDELSYRTLWFDYDALVREVIAPLRPGGGGHFLPRLWDEATDRSARARTVPAPANQIVLIAGPMLLGRGLNVDLSVQLRLSASALRRRTSDADQWTCAPLLAYYDGLDYSDGSAERPDLLVRWDHPDRPALERN